MGNKIKLVFILFLFPLVVNAYNDDTFPGPIIMQDHIVSTPHGTGKIFSIEDFNLKNNELNLTGTAYLKGWSNIVVSSKFKYTNSSGNTAVEGTYNPNVLYWFRLHSNSGKNYYLTTKPVSNYDWENPKFDVMTGDEKNGTIEYIHTNDLFRLICPIQTGGATKCYYTSSNNTKYSRLDVVGSGPQDDRVPHYRGGFKISGVNLDKIVEESGNYTLQVKIQVKGKPSANSKTCKTADGKNGEKNCYDFTDLCGSACEWQDLHGYVSKSQQNSANDASSGNSNVKLINADETRTATLIANSVYPVSANHSSLSDEYSCYSSTIPFSSGKNGFQIIDQGNSMFKTSGGYTYSGYKIVLPDGKKMNCKGNRLNTLRVPKSWFQVDGSLDFKITKDGGGNPTYYDKTYTKTPGESCGDGYSIIEVDRVLLTGVYNQYEGGNDLIGVCNGNSSSGTVNFIPFLYKNYDTIMASSINQETKNAITNLKNRIDNTYDLTDIKIKLDEVKPITKKYEAEGFYKYLGNDYLASSDAFNISDTNGNNTTAFIDKATYTSDYINSFIISKSISDFKNNSAFASEDSFYNSIIGIDSDSEHFNVENLSVTPDGLGSSFKVTRKFQSKIEGSKKTDIKLSTSGLNGYNKICKDDGSPNTNLFSESNPLLQPTIINVKYCAPPKNNCPEYEPDNPECKANEAVSGSFYETDEAHTCLDNFDDPIKMDEGFKVDSNDYCNIVCLDDVRMELPGAKGTYSGEKFDLNFSLKNESNKLPNINIKRSCYTKIDGNKFWTEYYNSSTDKEKEEYKTEINRCLMFKPNLFESGTTLPDVIFNYDDTEFKNNTAIKNMKLNRTETLSKSETIVSKTLSESISSVGINTNNETKYIKEEGLPVTGISCTDSACTYAINGKTINITDMHYIQKTQEKNWEYNTTGYYNTIPKGNVSNVATENSILINDNTIPVSLMSTPGEHKYTLKIQNLTDQTRKEKNGEDLEEKFKRYKMYLYNNTVTENYTCRYTITDDIVDKCTVNCGSDDEKTKSTNFFYRTINVSNPKPNASKGRLYGYNWNNEYLYSGPLVGFIRQTSDYQVLTGNKRKSGDEKYVLDVDHFSFRLTPDTMKKIRTYNSSHSYDDNSNFYIDDSQRENLRGYYYKSKMLECLGNEDNSTCSEINLGTLTNTTKNPSLLESSRDILKRKNEVYTVSGGD